MYILVKSLGKETVIFTTCRCVVLMLDDCVSQDQEEQAYFAVFDGHGGVDAAIYAANHLHVNLVHQESFSQDPSEALCRAFKVTDERFVKKASREVNTHLQRTETQKMTYTGQY